MRSQFGCLLMGVIHSSEGSRSLPLRDIPAGGIPGEPALFTSTWVSTPDIVALTSGVGKIQAPQTGPALSIFIKDSRPCDTTPPTRGRASIPRP